MATHAYQGFPETSWGLISRFEASPEGDYRAGLEALCCRYWRPVYCYLRVAWPRPEEDCKDLTQGFFLWLLEGEALRKYAPERGAFRTFLKSLLGHFVQRKDQAAHRLRRGAGAKLLSLEDADKPLREMIPDPKSMTPDEALDQDWTALMLDRAVARVREDFVGHGRETLFSVFEAYDLSPEEDAPTYASVGARLGLKATQVRDYLFTVRQAVRGEIRSELARLTRDDRELEEEWRALFRDPGTNEGERAGA